MNPVVQQVRLACLVRLLLTALALAALVFTVDPLQAGQATTDLLHWLVLGVAALSGLMLALSRFLASPVLLVLHPLADLSWIGLFIAGSGGVFSPAVPLLYVVVVSSTLVIARMPPLVLPALGALVLAVLALLQADGGEIPGGHLLGHLALKSSGLFLVDLLAHTLARRLNDQRIFTGRLLDQLGEGVLAVDRSGTVAYANAEALVLLQLPGSVQGQPSERLLGTPDLATPLRLLRSGALPVMERWSVGGRHLLLRVTELSGRDGRPIGRTLLMADETRLRVLEDDARRAEHLASLGEMAAGIAHEVRNPLTSLRGCAQELGAIARASGSADVEPLVGVMVAEADRLERIVTDFLRFSRLRGPERSPVDLADALTALALQLRQRPGLPTGLAIDCRCPPGCPPAWADRDQFQQILLNLAGNAVDALAGTAAPRLACRAEEAPADNPLGAPAVMITVADNGCGIPAELQERVFTPFYSTKAQGTGLGLALVARIVREHEGLLLLESVPGEGTTIRIYLHAHSQTREFRRALGQG